MIMLTFKREVNCLSLYLSIKFPALSYNRSEIFSPILYIAFLANCPFLCHRQCVPIGSKSVLHCSYSLLKTFISSSWDNTCWFQIRQIQIAMQHLSSPFIIVLILINSVRNMKIQRESWLIVPLNYNKVIYSFFYIKLQPLRYEVPHSY